MSQSIIFAIFAVLSASPSRGNSGQSLRVMTDSQNRIITAYENKLEIKILEPQQCVYSFKVHLDPSIITAIIPILPNRCLQPSIFATTIVKAWKYDCESGTYVDRKTHFLSPNTPCKNIHHTVSEMNKIIERLEAGHKRLNVWHHPWDESSADFCYPRLMVSTSAIRLLDGDCEIILHNDKNQIDSFSSSLSIMAGEIHRVNEAVKEELGEIGVRKEDDITRGEGERYQESNSPIDEEDRPSIDYYSEYWEKPGQGRPGGHSPSESKDKLCEKLRKIPAICPKLEDLVTEKLIDADLSFAVAGYEGDMLQVDCFSHKTRFIGSYKLRNPKWSSLKLGSFLQELPVFDVKYPLDGPKLVIDNQKIINQICRKINSIKKRVSESIQQEFPAPQSETTRFFFPSEKPKRGPDADISF
jgi:hypothetical protein